MLVDGIRQTADKNKFTIGPITLVIQKGDITKEKTDAIVNSSNEELDLSKGRNTLCSPFSRINSLYRWITCLHKVSRFNNINSTIKLE